MRKRVITLVMLQLAGACDGQLEEFEKHFGRRVVPTKALCIKHASDFNWNWAAGRFFSVEVWRRYEERCYKAQAKYMATYNKMDKRHFKATHRATGQVRRDVASWRFDAIMARATKKVQKTVAIAWFKGWQEQERRDRRRATWL